MRKKKETSAKKRTAQKVNQSKGSSSKQPPSTPREPADAAPEEPTLYDLNAMGSIRIDEPEPEGKPIIFSKTWYEFSVFAKVIDTHPNTVAKWLRKRWLAYFGDWQNALY